MKLITALAALVTSALLTIPTVTQASEIRPVLASVQAEAEDALA